MFISGELRKEVMNNRTNKKSDNSRKARCTWPYEDSS